MELDFHIRLLLIGTVHEGLKYKSCKIRYMEYQIISCYVYIYCIGVFIVVA